MGTPLRARVCGSPFGSRAAPGGSRERARLACGARRRRDGPPAAPGGPSPPGRRASRRHRGAFGSRPSAWESDAPAAWLRLGRRGLASAPRAPSGRRRRGDAPPRSGRCSAALAPGARADGPVRPGGSEERSPRACAPEPSHPRRAFVPGAESALAPPVPPMPREGPGRQGVSSRSAGERLARSARQEAGELRQAREVVPLVAHGLHHAGQHP